MKVVIGISNFDVCFVAIGHDFQGSLETTAYLKELGAKQIIARAASDKQEKFLLRNGADEVVYPEKQMAEWAAIRYGSEHIFDYIELGKDYSIFEIAIPKEWIGKTIAEIDIRQKYRINIMAFKKNGQINMDISSAMKLEGDETMLIL